MGLSAEQEAVCADLAPRSWCVASPGSGKTRTLTAAIARRINSGAVSPREILAVTFTRLAAREMRERLRQAVPQGRMPDVGTFHSICYEIIMRNWREAGFTSDLIAVYDRDDQKRIVKETIARSRFSPSLGSVIGVLDFLAREGCLPTENSPALSVAKMYIETLREHNAVDYCVTPYFAMQLIRDSGAGGRYREVYVDECQDLDLLQHWFFEAINPDRMVFVGDFDQLIYEWRGAAPEHALSRLSPLRADGHVHELRTNYRCSRRVIDAANRLIAHNEGRFGSGMRARPDADEGSVIIADRAHFASVVRSVAQENTAILVRTNALVGEVSNALAREEIEHAVAGKRERLLERDDVKTMLAYLVFPELRANPEVCNRVLRSEGVTQIGVDRSMLTAKRDGVDLFTASMAVVGALSEFYERIASMPITDRLIEVMHRYRQVRGGIQKVDEREMLKVLAEFVRATPPEHRTGGRLMAHINLRDGQEGIDTSLLCPTVMTMHASKGLEFDNVVIVGLEDGVMPHSRAIREDDIDGERRLMFVSMTRARNRLFLIADTNYPSRFIAEAVPEPSVENVWNDG